MDDDRFPDDLEELITDWPGTHSLAIADERRLLGTAGDLDDHLRDRIGRTLRAELSPRHVPDVIERIDVVPRTLSGKKLEVPVKRMLLGAAPDQVASRDSLQDPSSLDAVATWVAARRA